MECQWNLNVSTWNVGEPFDYRNVLLRCGKTSPDENVQRLHASVKQVYDNELAKLEEKKRLNPDQVFTHRDLPRCRVSPEEAELIGNNRIERIQNICKLLAQKSDIILLQEILANE